MKLPPFRTTTYAIWRACERFGIKPPGLDVDDWDHADVWTQAQLMAYSEIRSIEECQTS